MTQYYGLPRDLPAVFDPASIVQVNTGTTLTVASTNKIFMLNNPASYTVTLPALSTLTLGDTLQFYHNYSSGVVTIVANGSDTITLSNVSITSFLLNPGCSIVLRKLSTGTAWFVDDVDERRTAAQGTNDATPASTAFVVNEFNKHRNYLINGNFDFWQRSTGGSLNNYFYADRWQQSFIGSTITSGQQVFTPGQAAVPNEPRYFYRATVASVTNANNYSYIVHKIESVRSLAGKTATLSFWAKADTTKNIAIETVQSFGTGGSPSAPVTGISINTINLTTNWTKYNFQIQVPSISGKTIGTAGNDFLALQIWLEAGASFNTRTNNLGQQSGTFDFAQMQLEEGNVATPFEIRPLHTELALCQRYFERLENTLVGSAAPAGTNAYVTWFFKVSKRTAATMTYSSNVGTAYSTDTQQASIFYTTPAAASAQMGGGAFADAEL